MLIDSARTNIIHLNAKIDQCLCEYCLPRPIHSCTLICSVAVCLSVFAHYTVAAAAVFLLLHLVYERNVCKIYMTTAFRMDFIVDVMFHLKLQNIIHMCAAFYYTIRSIDPVNTH